MGTVYRFKVGLTGWIGGPGQNTWHMCQVGELGGADQSDLEGMANSIASVYNALKGVLVNDVRIDISPVVEGFDIETGQLLQVVGISAPTQLSGSSVSKLTARSVQICARLKTDRIRGNRLMQGRHFIGPIAADALGQDGQVTSAARNTVQNAYGGITDVAGDGRLVVWGQPNAKVTALRTGTVGYVQSVLANVTPGTLRSRKR